MADVITGNTQLTAVKAAAISELVLRELKPAAKLLPTVTDVSNFAGPGLKSISFPKFGSFTVEERASGVAGNAQTAAASVDTLDLNKNAYISWIIDNMDLYQTVPEVKAEYLKRAGSAHGRYVDDAILTSLDTNTGYNQAGAITKAKILAARKWLVKNQADPSKLTLVVHAGDEAVLLDIADFVQASMYGTSNIPNGVIGKIYGMNVIIHSKPTLAKSYIYSPEAVLIGFQKGAAYDEQKKIEYGTGAYLAAVDQLFGIKSSRLLEGTDEAGVALTGVKSPFIASIG